MSDPASYRQHNRLLARASAGHDPMKSEPAYYSQGAELDDLLARTDLTLIERARREHLIRAREAGGIALPRETWAAAVGFVPVGFASAAE